MKRKSNGIKEKEMGKRGGGGDSRHREKREREEEEENGGSGPFVHDFVLAITPFICISLHLFSEKPTPRGCRHC
jgi:hypothetical protein